MDIILKLLGLHANLTVEVSHQQLGSAFNSIITSSYDDAADRLDSMSLQGDDYDSGFNN